jgi:hypothetical protein
MPHHYGGVHKLCVANWRQQIVTIVDVGRIAVVISIPWQRSWGLRRVVDPSHVQLGLGQLYTMEIVAQESRAYEARGEHRLQQATFYYPQCGD